MRRIMGASADSAFHSLSEDQTVQKSEALRSGSQRSGLGEGATRGSRKHNAQSFRELPSVRFHLNVPSRRESV